jgi:DNA topoisomerase I
MTSSTVQTLGRGATTATSPATSRRATTAARATNGMSAPAAARRERLRRSDCSGIGLRRTRRGRGFSYLDEEGDAIKDPEVLERLRSLAIPPAWQNVWICSDPRGHLQATGIDAAGRKQYLYHPRWREHRDRQKFQKVVRFGSALPTLREQVAADLGASDEPTRARVLAGAVRLLDIGVFRIGSEEYADEDSGIGLATVRKDHVTVRADGIEFDYPAKGGIRRRLVIDDPAVGGLVATLRRRRGGGELLLAYRHGREWEHLRSDEINEYLKEKLGEDFSAKDFRTWNATVMAAVALGTDGTQATTKTARKRATDAAARKVAELLGNTPAVARRAYIDPRVFDRYQSGWTIAGALQEVADRESTDDRARATIEEAVLDLLADNTESDALERIEPVPVGAKSA